MNESKHSIVILNLIFFKVNMKKIIEQKTAF